jgi:putative two-component system response regulator
MERHAEVGHELLAGSATEMLETAAIIAWTHHERWDGSGYPCGLVGEEIPLEGRIVAVADVFDALTSDRPYRPAVSAADARAHLRAGRGTAFDPQVVDAFVGDVRRTRRNGSDESVAPRPASASIVIKPLVA